MHFRNRAAFSLIEIIAVMVMIALLATFLVPTVVNQLQRGRINTARGQIATLEASIQRFFMDCGFFPATEQGLIAIVEKPTSGRDCKNYEPGGYLSGKRTLFQDPWNNDYQYKAPGVQRPETFDIYSMGPDGTDGTPDDIGNWE